jgi:basic membrane lipoprotein Med (substrate-binding protein (PBP1-ABC) superfamily)
MKKKITTIMTVLLLMAVFFMGCAKNEVESSSTDAASSKTDEGASSNQEEKPKDTPSLSTQVNVGYVYSSLDCDAKLIKETVEGLMAISSTPFFVTVIDASQASYDLWIGSIEKAECDIVFLSGIDEATAKTAAQSHPEIKFELYGAGYEIKLDNLNPFYFRIYQQQYLNGMAAAHLSKSGNIGYISLGADSQDVRRVNAFALGAQAVNADAKVHFTWTGEISDNDIEMAKELYKNGCDVIFKSQVDDGLLEYLKENEIDLIGNCKDDYAKRAFNADALSYIIKKARASVQNIPQPEGENNWIGIKDYQFNDAAYSYLTDEQLATVKAAAQKISDGTWDVFTGPITDMYGNVIVPEGVKIPDEDLYYMLWYVGNIIAVSPPMG